MNLNFDLMLWFLPAFQLIDFMVVKYSSHFCLLQKDDKDVTPIEVNQIRSVKVSRGARNIPKAFEIFTGDQSLILKPKDGKNAEEWVQCLSVALAHSHARDSPANKTHSLPATLRSPL